MKIIELKEQSENQLQLLIKESKEKLNGFRLSLANKQLKDYSEIKKTKITIARIKSILKEREINSKITEK